MVQGFNRDGVINRKLETFEKIQNSSNQKDIVEIDVDDETGELKIVQLSKSTNSRANSCDKIRWLEAGDFTELRI